MSIRPNPRHYDDWTVCVDDYGLTFASSVLYFPGLIHSLHYMISHKMSLAPLTLWSYAGGGRVQSTHSSARKKRVRAFNTLLINILYCVNDMGRTAMTVRSFLQLGINLYTNTCKNGYKLIAIRAQLWRYFYKSLSSLSSTLLCLPVSCRLNSATLHSLPRMDRRTIGPGF